MTDASAPEFMKALSLDEPWGSALFYRPPADGDRDVPRLWPLKSWETRPLPVRGDTLPEGHAGRCMPGFALNRNDQLVIHVTDRPPYAFPPHGLIGFSEYRVGQATIGDEMLHISDDPDECCDDVDDGMLNPACVKLNTWVPALLHDEGAHGTSVSTRLLRRAIIGSVLFDGQAPIIGPDDLSTGRLTPFSPFVLATDRQLLWSHPVTTPAGAMWALDDISDQRPWGDWTPGRWAYRFRDADLTTARCPWCRYRPIGLGLRHLEPRFESGPCPWCDDTGACEPITTTGAQGVWRWPKKGATP